jgi:hypothetical protein
MADVGRGKDVTNRLVVLEVLQQALVGDLRRGAHDVDLDAGHLGEAAAQVLRSLRRVVCDVPGELAFLLGGFLKRLDIRMRRRRKGQHCDEREACQPLHQFLPGRDFIIVCKAYDHTMKRATSATHRERAHDGR